MRAPPVAIVERRRGGKAVPGFPLGKPSIPRFRSNGAKGTLEADISGPLT